MNLEDVRAYELEQQQKTNERVTDGVDMGQANVSR